jgi:hypothetical protein
LIISLSNVLDDEPVDESGLLTPFNRHQYIVNMVEFKDSDSKLLVLGTDEEHKITEEDESFSIISRHQIDETPVVKVDLPIPIFTHAGKYFYALLKQTTENDNYKCIQVDYNVQAESAFTTEEILEIMFISGYFNSVKSATISEYNPRIEDIITGQF